MPTELFARRSGWLGSRLWSMRRRRGKIEDAETLLRLLLLHVAGGLSLEQTSLRAREQGLAEVSDVALFKRLRTSEVRLQALTSYVLSTIPGSPYRAWVTTTACELWMPPSFRSLHYSLRLPELVCDFFELTDPHGAEHLCRLPVEPGAVVLADRGYSRGRSTGTLPTRAERANHVWHWTSFMIAPTMERS